MLIDKGKITFWLDGICSRDMGITVQGFPNFPAPKARVSIYDIPGRNGDLTYWDGSFENISAEIQCFITDEEKVERGLSAVNRWVANSEYKKLVISSELERFRLARVENAAEVAIRMGVLAPFTLRLNCKPQRFYNMDDTVKLPASGGTLRNPTLFISLPSIKVFYPGSIPAAPLADHIYISNSMGEFDLYITRPKKSASWALIDFELRRAITDAEEELTIDVFDTPGFASGENSITVSDSSIFTSFEISPRWWSP